LTYNHGHGIKNIEMDADIYNKDTNEAIDEEETNEAFYEAIYIYTTRKH
jgi:hypothetical protein